MGISRPTYYEAPADQPDDTEAIGSIHEEFAFYGWRSVRAELKQRGLVVDHKKIKHLMREHDFPPPLRRRRAATADSDHDQPIYPNRAKGLKAADANQLWVADITCVAIAVGFVYVAVVLDAWSRRVVRYAISRAIQRPVDLRRARGRHRAPQTAIRLRPSVRSGRPIRRARLSRRPDRPQPRRLHGTSRQPIRQR